MLVEPVTLEGRFVRLEPLERIHLDALCHVGLEAELWRWTVANIATRGDMENYVETALDERSRGVSLPFVTIDKGSDTVVGSTRFGNIDWNNRKAEIGWTWIGPAWQRTHVNTEAKMLMLTHAFEKWNCVRVELKTDSKNQKSRSAILRIGATEEGTLRRHMITESGRFRDSVYFSIIEDEWPIVKAALFEKLTSTPK
jgi:RimJ/RimL family protein N-acetyltransferase